MSNPFPNGLVQPTANSRGLLTGTGGDIYFVDPDKGAPRVQQFSADLQRELPGAMTLTLAYNGLKGNDLSWGGTQNALSAMPRGSNRRVSRKRSKDMPAARATRKPNTSVV